MDKISFRKIALERRASLFSSDLEKLSADEKLHDVFFSSGLLKNIKTVLTYVSFGDEAGTTKIIEHLLAEGFSVAVPGCGACGKMDFYRINSMDDLTPSKWGILEPDPVEENIVKDFNETLCIVPGMAFDLNGNRTGYGGGYYDRFLAAAHNVTAAGLCYDSLIYDEVPSEPHDISVDYIITEKGLFKING